MEGLVSREIVGRSRELTLIAETLAAAAAGRGRNLFLVGEAGIGKSSLRQEAERSAHDLGVVVLSGRATEGGPPAPYRPLAEALASGFRDSGLPSDRSVLSVRSTLAHLVPEWAGRPSAHVSVIAIAEAVLHLCAVAGRDRGVLIAVEDAHWADTDTIAVLEYLAHNAGAYGTSCLVTVRADPPNDAVRLGRRLADARTALLCELEPLDDAAVDRMVRSCLQDDAPPAELLRFVRERADGNPFFVEELLAGLVETGALARWGKGWTIHGSKLASTVPRTLAETVERRFAGLHPRTQQVLFAAALLGRRFDWSLLPPVTGYEREVVLASLREAGYAGLVSGQGEAIQFRHALTREHVLELMLPPERSELGHRALAAIEQARPGLPGHWCDLAAELSGLSGDGRRSARLLVEAAGRARDGGALGSAVARLERAKQLVAHDEDAGLLVEESLAEVLALAGEVDRALEHGRHALSARRERGEATGRDIDVQLTLGRALLAAARHDHAREYAYRAVRRAEAIGDPTRRASGICLLAQIAVADGGLVEARRLAEEALTICPDTTPEIRSEAHEVLGRCHRVHDVTRAEESFEAALEVADRHGLPAWRARALHELGTIDLLDTMRTDRLEAARAAASEAGIPATAALADFHLAAALVARGEARAGRVAARRAADLARRLGHSVLPWAIMLTARSYAHERDQAAMEAAISEARSVAPDDRALEAMEWGQVRAMLALHLADGPGACVALDRAAELLRACPGQHDPHRGMWALLRTVEDRGAAAARAETATAAGSGTRFNRALLRAAEAVDAGRVGEPGRAEMAMADATDMLRRYEGADWLIHLTQWIVGPSALAAGWGRPVAWLQDGVRWFSQHGHEPLATSCRTLLREAGATVPRRGRGTSEVPNALRAVGVTSREVDVLRLLGEHLSNREIADRLVLSPRTVERHVASLMRKTTTRDRGALERLWIGLDPVEGEASVK